MSIQKTSLHYFGLKGQSVNTNDNSSLTNKRKMTHDHFKETVSLESDTPQKRMMYEMNKQS